MIKTEETVDIESFVSTLIIEEVSIQNEGKYTCSAENLLGKVEEHSRITVGLYIHMILITLYLFVLTILHFLLFITIHSASLLLNFIT